VSKLCEHSRELMFELNAADETTNSLLANLIKALKEAPDSNTFRDGYLIKWTYGQ